MLQFFSKLKYVLRLLSILCLIFVFCPSFLVSCSGQEKKITAITAIKGVDGVAEPHYIMILTIAIPVLFLALLFMEKFEEMRVERAICAGSVVDFVLWILFYCKVKELAESYNCEFRACIWYVLNIIVHLALILLTARMIYKKLTVEADLLDLYPPGDKQITIKGDQNKEDIVGYCSKCGGALQSGGKFCIKCGAPVPQDMRNSVAGDGQMDINTPAE